MRRRRLKTKRRRVVKAAKQDLAPSAGSVYGEAPRLAERVGVYGGPWSMGITASFDRKVFRVNAGYENLVRWDAGWTRVIPNIAQSYEISSDGSEFTFNYRKSYNPTSSESSTASRKISKIAG